MQLRTGLVQSTPAFVNASDLQESVRQAARASLSFFARNVLGFRSLSVDRLVALQAGATPQLKLEKRILSEWKALIEGCPPTLPGPVSFFLVEPAA